jgi:hypothetical protein
VGSLPSSSALGCRRAGAEVIWSATKIFVGAGLSGQASRDCSDDGVGKARAVWQSLDE